MYEVLVEPICKIIRKTIIYKKILLEKNTINCFTNFLMCDYFSSAFSLYSHHKLVFNSNFL